MLKNYIKIAWRKIQSQRFYAITNILGLTIGISCCLLITLLVIDEISYDSYNERAEDIYRVAGSVQLNGQLQEFAVATSLMAGALESEVPEVENTVRFRQYGAQLVKKEGTVQNFREAQITYVDHSIFDVFTLPMIYGDKENVLRQPNTVVITESISEKYFGKANPVGESLIFDNQTAYVVDGVCADVPSNSHFHYDFFLSIEGLAEMRNDIWLSNNFQTYILSKPNTNAKEMEAKMVKMFRKYAGPQLKELAGSTFEEFEAAGNYFGYTLQPLRSIHLNSNLQGEHEANSDKTYVWIFSAIALFILLIACINFMNLATARSANRAKEVGMRKVLGSKKKDLIGQFLMESILMSSIAFSLALLLSRMALPAFNELTDKDLTIPFLDPIFLVIILGATILVGFLAGSYPAFFLSAFEPLKVLKGNVQRGATSGRLRQFLVTSQFSISIILMIGTGVIYNQLNYIQNKRLGFNKDQVLILNAANYPGSFEGLKDQLSNLPEVKKTSTTCYLPVSDRACRGHDTFWEEHKNAGIDGVNLDQWFVDYDYLETFGMEMLNGRFFSENFSTDTSSIVLNEAAVQAFGLENPIGTNLMVYVDLQAKIAMPFKVIGIVKNFNFDNLKIQVDPLIMQLNDDMTDVISMRFDANSEIDVFVDKVEKIWESNAAGAPFSYEFLDERFNRMYESEQQLGSVFLLFAGLAIFIACLGLLALAAFTAERRNKEISIRKILGASVPNLVSLLSSEFLKLVLIAIVISIPIAWYAMSRWLENFAYSVKMQWWIFVVAGIAAISIALLTVSVQSIRAALANPMKSLRSE